MFAEPGPRLFALPPGADFPALVARGLRERLSGMAPEGWARVRILVNTDRMRDAIIGHLASQGDILLPQVGLVTDLGRDAAEPGLPPSIPPLRRRLELSVLIGRLLDRAPDLAPRSALYDLADSLGDLLDEMQGEGVAPETIAALDVSDHSDHWQRTRDFMAIVAPFFGPGAAPDAEARQRLVVERLAWRWRTEPPETPVIVAGSTGSRGTTLRLMEAVAALPQGALILPGFDPDMPPDVWTGLTDALAAEDHPQFRYRRLFDRLGIGPGAVRRWLAADPPAPDRNRLISLALRPAPVTDRWRAEGEKLPDLVAATAGVTLIEAPDPRAEAMAIALMLREVAEHPTRSAALITADRALARRVTAALDRWGIRPDDSAGRPLSLSAPGRFLRMIAALPAAPITVESLLALLKHPLAAAGGDGDGRAAHLRNTRALERVLRRHGPAYPGPADAIRIAADIDGAAEWGVWLAACLSAVDPAPRDLPQAVADLLVQAGAWATGPGLAPSAAAVWMAGGGAETRAAMAALTDAADAGGTVAPADLARLLDRVLLGRIERDRAEAHPRIRIWGPREARVQGVELMILGGLNEGGWPQAAAPDPWMNRTMRLAAGLLLPERQIGLAAHDWQQAMGAPQVIMTRARRDDQAETVPSRWLNRLTNLMQGLSGEGQRGPQALAAMRARGDTWLSLVRGVEDPGEVVPPAPRPAPIPPLSARPRELPVTAIRTLIRDPYAVYAAHVLKLRPLDPLRAEADARLRGSILHKALEQFTIGAPDGGEDRDTAIARLIATADAVLRDGVPWPSARLLWLARIAGAAPVAVDVLAASGGTPVVVETRGATHLPGHAFRLTARPDRIDILPDGTVHIFDYKTGAPPTADQQKHFDKQLLLTAMIAEDGGFAALSGPRSVAGVTYLGLGTTPKVETVAITADLMDDTRAGLDRQIGAYLAEGKGFASRRAVLRRDHPGDYDHLARFGEWQMTEWAQALPVGDPE
ncbi:MAG: double-strand break repair protein AddB [Paracoccaceae bacterium]|nr:MAG: double-strand break repair protein AddB [Paracoccaceae bacterium]